MDEGLDLDEGLRVIPLGAPVPIGWEFVSHLRTKTLVRRRQHSVAEMLEYNRLLARLEPVA